MSRRSQLGILLEVFIMILILVLFTFFWSGYSQSTFLAGLFKVDDSAITHSCSNIITLVVGTDYIKSTVGTYSEAVNSLFSYLGFATRPEPIPNALYFYTKIRAYFPSLQNIYIKTETSTSTGTVTQYPTTGTPIAGSLRKATCTFPLYSTNRTITEQVSMDVYI